MRSSKRLTSIEVLYSYLRSVIASSHHLMPHQIRWIFLRCLDDYFAGTLDEQYVWTVACELYHVLSTPPEIDSYDRKLGQALSYATEIGHEYRHKEDSQHQRRDYEFTVKFLKEYYMENKYVLDNVHEI